MVQQGAQDHRTEMSVCINKNSSNIIHSTIQLYVLTAEKTPLSVYFGVGATMFAPTKILRWVSHFAENEIYEKMAKGVTR